MICQVCGIEAPTKHVSFHQNIGALVMRFSKTVEGNLCKRCIHKNFWSLTGTTLVLGWWGMISLVVTPIFVLNNVGRYLFCLGMPGVPFDAQPPVLTDEAIRRIEPRAPELFNRLNAGESMERVATDIAETTSVSPAQVILFVHAVVESQANDENNRDGA